MGSQRLHFTGMTALPDDLLSLASDEVSTDNGEEEPPDLLVVAEAPSGVTNLPGKVLSRTEFSPEALARLDRIIAPGSCGGSGESYFPNILGLRSVPRRSRARRGSATRRGSAVRSARLSPLRSTRLGSARRGSAPLRSARLGAARLRSAPLASARRGSASLRSRLGHALAYAGDSGGRSGDVGREVRRWLCSRGSSMPQYTAATCDCEAAGLSVCSLIS